MRIFKHLIPYFLPKNQVVKTNLVPMDEIDKIICFSNTAIGDTLWNTPVFRSLKNNFPDKELIVVLNPSNYKLFETNPYIDKIILYSGKSKHFLQVLKKLKKINPQLILILHSNEPQATPLAVLSGAKYIIKLPNNKNKFAKWHTNDLVSKKINEHYIKTRLKYLNYLGLKESNCKMDLFLKAEWEKEIKSSIPEHGLLIGFQIGTSVKQKMWFNDNWIELGKRILKKYSKANIILIGSPDEKKITNEIEKGLSNKRVINLSGKFSLGGAATLISKLDLLITPDTGPMHIAISKGIPTISLFASTNHLETGACYDLEKHIMIQKSRTCIFCIERRCKYPKCMEQISVEDVFNSINLKG